MNHSTHNNNWLALQSLAATGSFYMFGATPDSGSVGARDFRSAIISWQWAATSTPAGTFALYGNNQTGLSSESWHPIYLDANKVYGTFDGATYAHAGGATITVAGTGAGNLMVILDNISPFLRLTWTRTSGGAATGLTAAQYTLRSY